MSEQALIQDNSIQPSEQPKTEQTSQNKTLYSGKFVLEIER